MKVLFVGPSLSGELETVRRQFAAIDFRPPAACGDILRAVDEGATAIGLVDGYFGDLPSVWHKEILYALENDIAVGGGASMGALRAAECAPFGMAGLGSVYQDYASGQLMDDEAVALVHGPEELGWMPLSVPWVDFEATVTALHARSRITCSERRKLMLAGRFTHFSARTYASVVKDCIFEESGRAEQILGAFRRYGVDRKRQDAKMVVAWLNQCKASSHRRDWRFTSTSHWEVLRSEIAGDKRRQKGTRAA